MRVYRTVVDDTPCWARGDGDVLRALGGEKADRVLGPLEGAHLLAPVTPGKIVAVGLNYRDHIREAGTAQPSSPLLFAKFPSSIIGPGAPIRIDRTICDRVDWEIELGVVVGREMRRVPTERALEHVAGYVIANDVSARDLQFADGQWIRGKSLDTFAPVGPCMVTPDEVVDPQALEMRTWIGQDLVQDSTTAEMVFGVAEILAFCSANFTLAAGDLVLTGTPWGCGEFMEPPRSMGHGDVVRMEISGLGALVNPVLDEPA